MEKAERIINEVRKAVVGKDEVLMKIMMVILAKGHVLLEDIPGVGKTTIANAFAKAMGLHSKRMQFTIDVLPSDVVGFTVIDPKDGKAKLHKGAVFTNIFLADEINRTTSKTQAALLEVMEEGSITVDGYTQKAPTPFLVIATQNPYGSAGTMLLPESQLDRFTISLKIGYPSPSEEVEILKRNQQGTGLNTICAVTSSEDIVEMQEACQKVFVHDKVFEYAIRLIQATRIHPNIMRGASPRAGISLMNMARANAFLHDRDYAVPNDVKEVFIDTIAHRILVKRSALNKAENSETILLKILQDIPVPRVKE